MDLIMDDFARAAASFPEPFRLLIREEAGSTNDEARALAEQGAPDGLVVMAKRQTTGRGRRGSAWFASPDDALAFSILLRPAVPKALWPRYALVAGLAVADTLGAFCHETGLKWPNDVWLGQRKAAGILVEGGEDFVIVGIGVNINTASFPLELGEIATSLSLQTGRQHDRAEILGMILRHFRRHADRIDLGFSDLVSEIQGHCILTGQMVRAETHLGRLTGCVEGIGPGGELLLRTETGLQRLIQADEIRILPP
jgi:BirA family biotin operon repressor/biotin-[acetyl-CoA-carboxylase] ligase